MKIAVIGAGDPTLGWRQFVTFASRAYQQREGGFKWLLR